MKPTTGYPSQPFITRHEFEVVCPETTIIILEKCTKHRIKNLEKLRNLSLMRHGQATDATIQFFQQTKRGPQHKKPIIRLFANSKPASAFNEEQLTSILQSNSSLQLHELHAKDTSKGTKERVKMTATEEASLAVDEQNRRRCQKHYVLLPKTPKPQARDCHFIIEIKCNSSTEDSVFLPQIFCL